MALFVFACAQVYHAHAGVVGPMEGLLHLMRLMDLSLRRPLRHHLLLLMAAALQPRSAQTSPQVGSHMDIHMHTLAFPRYFNAYGTVIYDG